MAFQAAFFKGNHTGIKGLYNRFVRFWTNGKYSHMALIFSDEMTGSSTWTDGGVFLDKRLYNDSDWDYVTLPDYLESKSRAWFENHKGNAYDWVANIRFGLGFIPDDIDKFDCSGSCLASLGFIDSFRYDPNAAHSAILMVK